MQILFIYKDKSIQVIPIELRFCHKENEYGQLYVAVHHMNHPIELKIPDLFQGVFVNSIIYDTYMVMYFMNQYQEINKMGYYDPWINRLIHDRNITTHSDLHILQLTDRIIRPAYHQILLTYTQESNSINNPSKCNDLTPSNHIVMNMKLNAMLKNLRQYMFESHNVTGYGHIHIPIQCLNNSVIKYIFRKLYTCISKTLIIPLNLTVKVEDCILIHDKPWQIISIIHYITCTIKTTTLLIVPKYNVHIFMTTKNNESTNIIVKNRKVIASPAIYKKIFNVLVV